MAAYGSQVWLPSTEAFKQMAASLTEDIKKSAVDNTSTCLSKIATDPIERLHLSFLKWTMGVNKYTSNAAVWGDTQGRIFIISLGGVWTNHGGV